MNTKASITSPHTHLIDFLHNGTRVLDPAHLSKDEANCPICTETYTKNPKQGELLLEILACRHKFCTQCLSTHVRSDQPNSNKCPLCRRQLFFTTRFPSTQSHRLNEEELTAWQRILAEWDGQRDPDWSNAVHFHPRHAGHVDVTLTRYGTDTHLRLQDNDWSSLGQSLVAYYRFWCRRRGTTPLPIGEAPESELLLSYHESPHDGTHDYQQEWTLSLTDEDFFDISTPFDGRREPPWGRRVRFFGYPRLGYVEYWFMRRRGEIERYFLYREGDAEHEMLGRLYHFRCCTRRLERIPLLRGSGSGLRTVSYDDGSIMSDPIGHNDELAPYGWSDYAAEREGSMMSDPIVYDGEAETYGCAAYAAEHDAASAGLVQIPATPAAQNLAQSYMRRRSIQSSNEQAIGTQQVFGNTMSSSVASSGEISGDNGGARDDGDSTPDLEQLWDSLFPFTIA